MLAALVVTQTVGGDREIVFDERLAGVAAGAVAIWLRAPLIVVMVVAAGHGSAHPALLAQTGQSVSRTNGLMAPGHYHRPTMRVEEIVERIWPGARPHD